jgi:hypothetical protein
LAGSQSASRAWLWSQLIYPNVFEALPYKTSNVFRGNPSLMEDKSFGV